jgi:hypothetical protein
VRVSVLARMDVTVKGFFLSRRIESTLSALEAIARRLSGVQERKNLIWVSSAVLRSFNDGLGQPNADPGVKRAARAITDADVAVYPVDARGLVGTLTGPPGSVDR